MPVNDGDGGARSGNRSLSPPGASEQLRAPLSTNSVLDGKYRLEILLGEGGMGSVWRAHHLQLDLPVAIKLLRPGSEEPNLYERLKIEARAAAQLTHPAIVRVFDVDVTDTGEPYIVMELLGGQNLADMLDRGRLSPVSAVQILLPIAEALGLAHSKGVVHRDLKPHNVFISDDGDRLQPKLLDFGIAKLTQAPLQGSLTDTGVPIGSPDYMSPEQARGSNDVDYRADIWAFCVVLYEAVRGDIPFRGDNYNALMRAIVECEPEPLPVEGELDQRLADLIAWGLAKERSERPESIQELGRELARWLLDRGISEDVCGTPLGPKWITRTAQRSMPVILPNESEPPPSAVHTETLVSPRLPSASAKARSKRAVPIVVASAQRRGWLIGSGLALLAAGLVWAMAGRQARSVGSHPAPSSTPTSALVAPVVPPTAPVGIAPTPPLPSLPLLPPPAVEQPAKVRGNLAPAVSAAARKQPAPVASLRKKDGESSTPKPAEKPARVVDDEARELLQAY
jgi:serine/threonine-protein kinase